MTYPADQREHLFIYSVYLKGQKMEVCANVLSFHHDTQRFDGLVLSE